MFEILILCALIVLNGVLAMSELAVVSSRPARLEAMVRSGRSGARAAQLLAADPGRFLSSVQIGITLVGILSGAFGGATLGQRLSDILIAAGLSERAGDTIGVGVVVAIITYMSLIIGELVPKQLALRNPEAVASTVAPAMRVLAVVAAPLVWLLDKSGKAVLRLFKTDENASSSVTEDEIRLIVAEAETAGVVEPEERRMISAVLRLGERSVRAVMTARHEIQWIDLEDDREAILADLRQTRHSRLPAARGSLDAVEGVVVAKTLIEALMTGGDAASCVEPAPVVIDTLDALDALETLRGSSLHMALVHDEYGQFEGVLTSFDLLESIVGAFPDSASTEDPMLVMRNDGSYLVDGLTPVDDLSERLATEFITERGVQSVAGIVISALRRLPEVGETVEIGGFTFEVVDMDGRRIDKVLVSRVDSSVT
jgi:putative hemolysin